MESFGPKFYSAGLVRELMRALVVGRRTKRVGMICHRQSEGMETVETTWKERMKQSLREEKAPEWKTVRREEKRKPARVVVGDAAFLMEHSEAVVPERYSSSWVLYVSAALSLGMAPIITEPKRRADDQGGAKEGQRARILVRSKGWASRIGSRVT